MSKQPAPASAGTQTANQVRVKITRKGGHRHAGQKHPEGTALSVSPRDAEIIVGLKAGEPVKGE